MADLLELADRVEAGDEGNTLDVLIEVALFKPNEIYSSIRANEAGTKIIVTDHRGSEITFRAWDWTMGGRRTSTAAALRALAASHHNIDAGAV